MAGGAAWGGGWLQVERHGEAGSSWGGAPG
jgi:hypothetical protein